MSEDRDIAGALRELVRELVREELRRERETSAPAEYLTATEAAELARCHPTTVRRWIREGRLDSFRPGRHVLVRRDELESLIRGEARRHDDPSERAREDFA